MFEAHPRLLRHDSCLGGPGSSFGWRSGLFRAAFHTSVRTVLFSAVFDVGWWCGRIGRIHEEINAGVHYKYAMPTLLHFYFAISALCLCMMSILFHA